MSKTLALLETYESGVRAYVLGLTTSEALELFAPQAALEVLQVSGYVGDSTSARYIAQGDLPAIRTVAEAVRYIRDNETLALIDFRAVVDGVEVSTHDDAEAAFKAESLSRAVDLLDAAAPGGAVAKAALTHFGKYVLVEGEAQTVFENFDQALASGRLSPD